LQNGLRRQAILPYKRGLGRLAQLVEHLAYTENVGGSSPSPPTSLRYFDISAGKPKSLERQSAVYFFSYDDGGFKPDLRA
jgi:hypothetical protein